MQNTRKELAKYFIAYIILLLIEGAVRNHMISKVLPESYQSISNITNGFSLLFSTLFMAIIMVISMVCTFLYATIFVDKMNSSTLFEAWKNLLLVDIIFEVIKFALLWIMLERNLSTISVTDTFSEDLMRLPYSKVVSYIDLSTIIVSTIVFTVSLYKSNIAHRLQMVILGILLLALMLLLYFKII